MATVIPEFISVLRNIRDVIYPTISGYVSVVSDKINEATNILSEVIQKKSEIVLIQNDVNEKNISIKGISVVSPVISVPNKPNGNTGDADVIYNASTNQFTFKVPIGQKGDSMRIDGTVALVATLYTLTVSTGDVWFVEADNKIYVKLNTGTNTGASDWSTGMLITPATSLIGLSDVPNSYSGNANKLLLVNSGENGTIFASSADIGVIGYNYVKNPLFEYTVGDEDILANSYFGTDEEGYGTFTTVVGTPSSATDNILLGGTNTMTNPNVYAKGKSLLGIRVKFEALVNNATVMTTGNMKIFVSSTNTLVLTNGTTNNNLSTMTLNTTDTYDIIGTETDLIVLNRTTGMVYSSQTNLAIATQTSGVVTIGGTGFNGKVYAVILKDRTYYSQVDGQVNDFASGWKYTTTGGDLHMIADTRGATKGMKFISGGLATIAKVRMLVGDGGQLNGKKVTFSFTAYSSGVGSNVVQVDFITDRGSLVANNRYLTQSLGSLTLENGVEKNYVATFTLDTIDDTVFLEKDAIDYITFSLPSGARSWIDVKKPKIEISEIQTDFTPQRGLLEDTTITSKVDVILSTLA